MKVWWLVALIVWADGTVEKGQDAYSSYSACLVAMEETWRDAKAQGAKRVSVGCEEDKP